MAESLQQFTSQLSSQDIKKRIQLGTDILNCLRTTLMKSGLDFDFDEIGSFIDGVSTWLNNSNFKVAQNGLEIITILAEMMKEDFKPYISTIFSPAVDRLGDGKDQVRIHARILMRKLMDPVSSPQYIFDKLAIAFNHKNFRVREEVMVLLQSTLDEFGSSSLMINKLMPFMVKLLSDPNSQVRDTALSTLVHVYKHVGDRLRQDISKRAGIPPPKMHLLMLKFDEVRNAGALLPSAMSGARNEDEVDSKSQSSATKSAYKRASSAPPVRRTVLASTRSLANSTTSDKTPKTPYRVPTTPRTVSMDFKMKSFPKSVGGTAGGADEEMFMKAFEDVPRVSLYSARELESELTKIKEVLGDANNDWEKRIEKGCKRLRALIIAGAQNYEEFLPFLRQLESPFQLTIKDLRSQVVREGCITIAYLSQQLGIRLDHFSEALLPSLINLIPNSAKIMSTAGIVAIRFIIRYTHVSRLVPILTSHLSSKSKDIRKTCFEFLDQLLLTWPTHSMERHVGNLSDAIRKGISDADPEARAFSRKAFWSFADHFREEADHLLNSLESSKQRMLHDELNMSNSSSSSSLTHSGKPYRPTATVHAGSVENLSSARTGTLGRRTGISNLPPTRQDSGVGSGIPRSTRSTSAIDLSAVRRAKARATYSTIANLQRGSGASLPRTPGIRRNDTSIHAITSPERVVKSRPRGSQSQPSSRPDSPSSRLSYATYSIDGKERRLSGSRTRLTGAGEKYPSLPSSVVPLMSEKLLQQSTEAEVAVADALRAPVRRRYNAFDDQSDESETSSVCSDRSYGSYGRSVDDVNEIIHNLHSIHWSDRKEGLQALQSYFRSGRYLSTAELKKVTDIFARIFMDPHIKVFSLFLDSLNELIMMHKNDLFGWLYVLLTRLFHKMGCDILGSVLVKIQKTLELVKDSFPYENQFSAIMKFLNDQTQTPNNKVKISLLKYLHSLLSEMDPSKFSSANTEVSFAFVKVISWTTQPKSDLKKHVEDVFAALFNLNPSEYSNLIEQLPKSYKDLAYQFLTTRYQKSGVDSPRSLTNRMSPCPVMSPNSVSPWPRSHGGTPQSRSFEYDDTENLNPEEISNSWKKTMSEIEEYKSDDFYDKIPDKIIQESPARNTGSQHNSLEARFERLDLNSALKASPKHSPTETVTSNGAADPTALGHETSQNTRVDNEIDDHKFIYSIVDELNENSSIEKQLKSLERLIMLIQDQSSIITIEAFRMVFSGVIQLVTDTSLPVKTLALKVLRELIRTKPDFFHDFIELTLMRILDAHKDQENDVIKQAECCSAVAAMNFPPDKCVTILKALIETAEMPVNQAAVKMLYKLVEHHPKVVVLNMLPDIMPALIKAYDHTESAVRKAAVFCMVAIHCKVGDAMKPYLVDLNSCKQKLLNVYIRKAEEMSARSSPGSPSNPPSSTSSQ